MALKIVVVAIQILYLICAIGLTIYGVSNMVSTVLYLRTRKQKFSLPIIPEKKLPKVTVQLPIFNERYLITRLLKAVTDLEYPRDKLQIQILDDSTDETALMVRTLVEKYVIQGFNFELIQRSDRSGFKAGALKEGLKTATGELIAVFDADFVPPQDWLCKTVPAFADPQLGCLQTRWGHLNHNNNAFTRAVALGLNGHFIIEQTARSRNNLFMSFNGTAGLWRKGCINDAGGWTTDTLTEDLDLSYRAQLRGWRIGYLPDVVVPAELPVQIEAFKKQQFRWAKGTYQTVKKIVPKLLRADIPERTRLMGLIHITGYGVHPLMVGMLLLTLPLGLLSPSYLNLFPWTVFASLGPPLLYIFSRTEEYPRWIDRLRQIPMLILIGFGISLSNSVAVMEGLFKRETGDFVRTPKFNLTNTQHAWNDKKYSSPISPMVWGELVLALYSLVTIFLLTMRFGPGVIPFLLMYFCGYIFIAGVNIQQSLKLMQKRTPATVNSQNNL